MASPCVSPSIVSLAMGVTLSVVSCTDRPSSDTDGATAASSTGSPAGETTLPEGATVTGSVMSSTTAADSTGAASDGGLTGNSIFCNIDDDDEDWHCPPDGGSVSFECDLFAQDCIEGDKCLAWANDGGPAWNATRCAPIAPMPGQPGEACTVEGVAVSGIDSCDIGSMCWGVDPLTLQGECVAQCGGDGANPVCEDASASCVIHNEGAIALCLPFCDPLSPSACDADETCIPEPSGGWACVPGITTPSVDGEPCEYGNVCSPGSVCASPGCNGSVGCCTPLCDVELGACADAETECVAWYPLGSPPGLEETGLCVEDPTARPRSGWVDHNLVRLASDTGR